MTPKPGRHFRVRFAATISPNEPSKIGNRRRHSVIAEGIETRTTVPGAFSGRIVLIETRVVSWRTITFSKTTPVPFSSVPPFPLPRLSPETASHLVRNRTANTDLQTTARRIAEMKLGALDGWVFESVVLCPHQASHILFIPLDLSLFVIECQLQRIEIDVVLGHLLE